MTCSSREAQAQGTGHGTSWRDEFVREAGSNRCAFTLLRPSKRRVEAMLSARRNAATSPSTQGSQTPVQRRSCRAPSTRQAPFEGSYALTASSKVRDRVLHSVLTRSAHAQCDTAMVMACGLPLPTLWCHNENTRRDEAGMRSSPRPRCRVVRRAVGRCAIGLRHAHRGDRHRLCRPGRRGLSGRDRPPRRCRRRRCAEGPLAATGGGHDPRTRPADHGDHAPGHWPTALHRAISARRSRASSWSSSRSARRPTRAVRPTSTRCSPRPAPSAPP